MSRGLKHLFDPNVANRVLCYGTKSPISCAVGRGLLGSISVFDCDCYLGFDGFFHQREVSKPTVSIASIKDMVKRMRTLDHFSSLFRGVSHRETVKQSNHTLKPKNQRFHILLCIVESYGYKNVYRAVA